MADDEERKRILLEEGRRRFAKMKEKRAAASGVEIPASPSTIGSNGHLEKQTPTIVPTTLFPPAAVSFENSTKPYGMPESFLSAPISTYSTPPAPTPGAVATTIDASKLIALENENRLLIDQKSRLEDVLRQRETEIAKLKLDLEQEKSSHSVQNQELLNHISKLNQQRGELEAKMETLVKAQSSSKQTEESLKAVHDQMKAQQTKFEETRLQLQQQVDSLQKQLKDSQIQYNNAVAKAQQDQASSKQQELSKLNEVISQLQQQLRSAEANIADKDRLHEETLKQERLRAAQTVASMNSRCELLQKQLEEAQVKLTFEKNQNQGKQNPQSTTNAAEVVTLKTLLADAERKAASSLEQLQERDARIAKLADELKTAMQRQFPPSPQLQRPAVKPELSQPVPVQDTRQIEELIAALDTMQQNRSTLAKELAKEMAKSTSLTAQIAALQTTVQQLQHQLQSVGVHVPPISTLLTAVEEKMENVDSEHESSPDVEPQHVPSSASEPLDVEPTTPKKAAPAPEPSTPASASSRLPPPSATKPEASGQTQESYSSVPKANGDRGSWSLFGRIWGSGPKPPPTKQNGSAQVIV